MSQPDYRAMAEARAKIDDQLNRVLAFLAPTTEDTVVPVAAAQRHVADRIKAAANALRQFETAAQGGAR